MTNPAGPAGPASGAERTDLRDVTVLAGGTVLTNLEDPRVLSGGAVAWADGRIVGVGPEEAVGRAYPGAARLDARGGLILPGLVNLHHHFYSALARGLDPGTRFADFGEVLDRLWWRLDRALDPESVRISALLSVAECVRWGCTTVFDHHASPSCIGGSLDVIAEAVEAAGLSAILCYEVTDRNGPEGARAGLEENLRFLAERRKDERIRGVIGLHASFTLRDETLAAVAERRPAGTGCHVHAAEDPIDVEASERSFGAGPIRRLADRGLLDGRCLLAHGIHLGPADYDAIAEAGSVLIHNPESNANNGVGRLDVPEAAGSGCLVGLGTDGMSSAVLRALRFAFLGLRDARRDPNAGFEALPGVLAANARVAGRFLGEARLGTLEPGAPADVIVVDAPPPTPIGPENWFGHLVYGASEAPVRHTVARGRVLLEDFRPLTLDPGDLAERARALSPPLWRRFRDLAWGTPHLGEGGGA
ncbi:MAG: amidohydrolase family protein [Gemmatimonadota bacterium]